MPLACQGHFGPVRDLVRRTKSPGKLGPAGPIFLWGKWSGPGTFGLALAVALALALAVPAGPNLPGMYKRVPTREERVPPAIDRIEVIHCTSYKVLVLSPR